MLLPCSANLPRWLLPWLLAVLLSCANAASPAATPLPPEVDAALARARIGRDAVSLLVTEAQGGSAPRLAHRTQVAMNPASVMKLATTYAALELLGPAYVWTTPVYVQGKVQQDRLDGHVYIRGSGDPKLVLERLWLLLRRLQGLGIRQIGGDLVLDHSAFEPVTADPARFDGEPLRPYNATPDALLLNYKAVLMTFTPEPGGTSARVQYEPPLAGVQMQERVPLAPPATECGDYRGALKADFADPARIRFAGSYPPACGEKLWPVAYADPASYAPRALQGLWQEMGGSLEGTVRWGTVPAALLAGKPSLEVSSPPLAEVIRDINKYSNSVMAQQLFLTLGQGSQVGARAALQRWWSERLGDEDLPVLDNGSGLSRQERVSAQGLARLLQLAYRSPYMPELMASLPIAGVDGTLQRYKGAGAGIAHLKSGTLHEVLARAGYVDGHSGRRYVLVALINHPNANTEAARAAIDALVDWTARD